MNISEIATLTGEIGAAINAQYPTVEDETADGEVSE